MKLIKLWLPVILWVGVIYFFSSIPGVSSGLAYDTLLRKVAHVVEYFILTGLLFRAFKGEGVMDQLSLIFYPSVLCLLYAVSDEIHQLFVPRRHGCAMDVFIDSFGVVLFYLIKFNKQKILKLFFESRPKSL